jgi:hypothetical protein
VAKQATRLSAVQLALFRAVVEAQAQDARKAKYGIASLLVHNLPLCVAVAGAAGPGGAGGAEEGDAPKPPLTKDAKLSASEKEATLRELVQQGWLLGEEEEDGSAGFRAGPRAFLELSTYLLGVAREEVENIWKTYV